MPLKTPRSPPRKSRGEGGLRQENPREILHKPALSETRVCHRFLVFRPHRPNPLETRKTGRFPTKVGMGPRPTSARRARHVPSPAHARHGVLTSGRNGVATPECGQMWGARAQNGFAMPRYAAPAARTASAMVMAGTPADALASPRSARRARAPSTWCRPMTPSPRRIFGCMK